MLREVIEARCDRCGRNKCYPHGTPLNPKTQIEVDGWEERLGRLLCADCVRTFDSMTEKFFNEIWDR